MKTSCTEGTMSHTKLLTRWLLKVTFGIRVLCSAGLCWALFQSLCFWLVHCAPFLSTPFFAFKKKAVQWRGSSFPNGGVNDESWNSIKIIQWPYRIHGTCIFTHMYHKDQPFMVNIPYIDGMGVESLKQTTYDLLFLRYFERPWTLISCPCVEGLSKTKRVFDEVTKIQWPM